MKEILQRLNDGDLVVYERSLDGGRMVPASGLDQATFEALVGTGLFVGEYPEFIDLVNEYKRAVRLHPPHRSAHESYAIIAEEVDELWDEIRKKKPDVAGLREEALHVAATGIRFMIDICRNINKEEGAAD